MFIIYYYFSKKFSYAMDQENTPILSMYTTNKSTFNFIKHILRDVNLDSFQHSNSERFQNSTIINRQIIQKNWS